MKRCPGEEALSAYLDGEATEEEMAHVRSCAGCAAAVARLGLAGARLKALPPAGEVAPPALAAALRRHATPSVPVRSRRRLGWFFAGVPAIAAVAAAFALALGGDVSPALAAEAAAVHLAAGATCEWTGERDEVARQLAATLGREVELPLPHGAELLGASPCTLAGEKAVAVRYRAGGEAWTLVLPPDGGAAARACGGGRSCRTVDGQTVCNVPDPAGRPRLVVGPLPADRLCATLGGNS